LSVEESAAQRDRQIADMAQLRSLDEATDWVHKNMPVKNELTAADADLVGAAFRDRLAVIEAETLASESGPDPAAGTGGTGLNEPLPDSGGPPSLGPGEEPTDGAMFLCDQPSAPRGALPSRRFDCVTKSTANMWRRRPVSFAAGRRAKRTIFVLPNLVRSVEKSATNIRFPSVGSITVNCTALVTKPHGGRA
jgi:hypothetical protein